VDVDSTAQFHIEKYEKGITNNITLRLIESGFRNDSVAFLHFFFERQMGFFLLQIYTPLLVIVMCSWVAFWIVKTDAPARSERIVERGTVSKKIHGLFFM
jgi:hypothetical protein